MFHVERLADFLKDCQTALKGFYQGISPQPSERGDNVRHLRTARAAEEKDNPTWLYKGLQSQQYADFNPYGTQRQNIEGFVQFGSGKQLLVSACFNRRVREPKSTNRLA